MCVCVCVCVWVRVSVNEFNRLRINSAAILFHLM